MKTLQPVWDALRPPQRKATMILLVASVVLLLWKYYCAPEIYEVCFAPPPIGPVAPEVGGAVCHFLSTLLLLGVVPVLIVKRVFGESLRDYGVSVGVVVRTVRTFLIFAPIFAIAGYVGSHDPAMLERFPINRHAGQSLSMFALHAATYFLYYMGWEFFFRGFMLFGLRASVGDANAVLIQTLASALVHIGNPAAETFGAIIAGLLWGMLALRTRSLLSGLGQHFLLGITLDWFLCFG